EALRVPVRQSWFWQALSPYLASGELPVKEARIILSREADAGEGHMPSIMNVLWWLAFVGLITMDNDQVRLNGSQPADAGAQPAGQPSQPAPPGSQDEKPTGQAGEPSPAYVVAFSLDVRMTMDDLARLSPEQVKSLFESVGTVMALSSA